MKKSIAIFLLTAWMSLSAQSFSFESNCELRDVENSGFWDVLFGELALGRAENRGSSQLTDSYIGSSVPDSEWRGDFIGALECRSPIANNLSVELGSEYQVVGTEKPAKNRIEALQGYSSVNGSDL